MEVFLDNKTQVTRNRLAIGLNRHKYDPELCSKGWAAYGLYQYRFQTLIVKNAIAESVKFGNYKFGIIALSLDFSKNCYQLRDIV